MSAPHEFPCPQCGGASEHEPGCVRVNDPGADGDRSPGLTNGGYSTERSGTLLDAHDLIEARLVDLSGNPPLTDDQIVGLRVRAGRLADVLGIDSEPFEEAIVGLAQAWPK